MVRKLCVHILNKGIIKNCFKLRQPGIQVPWSQSCMFAFSNKINDYLTCLESTIKNIIKTPWMTFWRLYCEIWTDLANSSFIRSHRRCPVKKVLWKISPISWENTGTDNINDYEKSAQLRPTRSKWLKDNKSVESS